MRQRFSFSRSVDRAARVSATPHDDRHVGENSRWRRPWLPRGKSEQGVAALEFALVAQLLFLFLLGIVVFGMALGRRQVLSQSAAEGARAAVPVPYVWGHSEDVLAEAWEQTNASLESTGAECPALPATGTIEGDGIECTFVIFDCAAAPGVDTAADSDDCIQVQVRVDPDRGSFVPAVPFVSVFLPDTMTGRYVARLDGFGEQVLPSTWLRDCPNGSAPDEDGHGPDRDDGADKPPDGDCNNGCGNDTDMKDDNEGWCGDRSERSA